MWILLWLDSTQLEAQEQYSKVGQSEVAQIQIVAVEEHLDPTGAYTIVEIDVVPGESYVLCAGCAYCCFGDQTTNGYCGGNTWFCVANGSYVCTMSGLACFTDWLTATRSRPRQ